MPRIELSNIGRRFNKEWIFRGINLTIKENNKLAILGSNGSGKSTLLQIISGHLSPSEGNINYQFNSVKTEIDDVYKYIGFAAPYMEVIEEFTLTEFLIFHNKFKPFINNYSEKEIIDILQLNTSGNKEIRNFSSGMKQRVKLTCALLSDVPVILLDEPASNLDKQSIQWYRNLIENYSNNKIIVVCSNNQPQEFDFCNEQIIIEDYKK
ncbi:MAG: ABC transporter ATP-binding protein [Bacteroidia bacterium]